jgi:hypothetical protein
VVGRSARRQSASSKITSDGLESKSVTQRTRRGLAGSVLVVLAVVVAAVVVGALRADGRERSKADTNDGGAWLLKRDVGVVGHVNRVVAEVTTAINIAEPGADYDVDQARDVIVVHDRTVGAASIVDDRTSAVVDVAVDGDIDLHAVDRGVLAIDTRSLTVWQLDLSRFAQLESLDEAEPLLNGEGHGIAAVRTDGTAAIVDAAAGRVIFLAPDGTTERSPRLGLVEDVADVTLVGDRAVVSDADGHLLAVTPDSVTVIDDADAAAEERPRLRLQQPGPRASQVVGVSPTGDVVAVDLADGSRTPVAALGGEGPVAPIVHGGCVFAVVTQPARYVQMCGRREIQSLDLDGAGSELRLRLVNGWVWINDLATGAAWVTSPENLLDRVEDWGSILSDDVEVDENTTENEGGKEETRVNPDAEDVEFREADQLDEDGINDPPIARDDRAKTRRERPVKVDVLRNDEDPDGDVILVDAFELSGGDAQVWVTDAHDAIQVTPAVGFEGSITLGYTISDGRGLSDSATVTVDVSATDGSDNQPPQPNTDVASTRRGRPTTLDVLQNDLDPDGDTLVLQDVVVANGQAGEGSIVSDPSGHLVFTPDAAGTAEQIELTYTVSDDFGETAKGRVIVKVRLDDSNSEPDARNDAAVAVVGKPVTLNLLDNDTDPDDDPLFIAQRPNLVQPADRTIADLEITASPDGELFFLPDAEGTYLFTYGVTDGQETDVAQVRVDVTKPDENRPPVAVRDDVVIPAGGSRMVYVLENDGDPDGDVVGLVDHSGADTLEIEEIDGLGYRVTVAPDAPTRVSFRYQISDGRSDPVTTDVVVSVIDTTVIDQPPVAGADVIEVRPGGSVTVPVLANDYDPEGSALEVTTVTKQPGAVAAPGLAGQSVELSVEPTVRQSFDLGYTVVDAAGNSSAAVVRVRIVPPEEPNRPPIARFDIARTRGGVPIEIPVLNNDSDPDGDAIDVESVVAQPAGGAAFIEADGTITYRPSDTFSGTDRLTYAVVDASGERAIGEVLIGVMPVSPVNRPPEARDDRFEVVAGSSPIALDALENDYDPDGDRLAITDVGGASLGSVEVAGEGGAVRFVPPDSVTGAGADGVEIAVSYSIDDGRGGTDSGTIVIVLIPAAAPIAPIAVDDQAGPAVAGERVSVDVLANDLDPDGDPSELTVSSADPAVTVANSTVSVLAGESSSRHRYTVTDAAGLTDAATIALIVVDNRAPVVAPLTVETPADRPVVLDLAAQATDPDGDELFFVCCSGARGGRASVEASGPGQLTARFVPNTEFTGLASLSFTVDDQNGHRVAGSVAINVLPPANRPPVATDQTIDVAAGTTGTVDLSALVTDPDPGDRLRFDHGAPAQGAVGLGGRGATVRVEAAIEAAGRTDTFDFTATDPAGEQAAGVVTINVTPPPQPPPEARPDGGIRTNQGEPVTIAVLDNDIDHLGQGLQIVNVGATDAGQAAARGRRIVFSPGAAFFGTTTFGYTIRDAAQREASAQVTVDVVGRPGLTSTPSASAGNAVATITWQAASPNGAPIDDYEIRVNGGGGQSIGNTTSYTWDGLTNGEAVQFSVRAHNAAGWGEWSEPSAPVTPDIEPGRPSAPTVTFDDGALIVNWTPPYNEGSAIQSYNLQIGGSANEVRNVGGGTSARWDGLTNGVEYTFMVQAVNAKGPGEFSSPSASEHPLRAPDAPAAPVAVRGDRSLSLSWGQPGNGGDAISEYRVQMASSGATNSTTSTSVPWANLPNGVEQQFRVQARNRGGWGPWSPYSVPVKPCGVPDTPAAPAAVRGDTAATVSWTAPNDQGCGITGYEVTNNAGQVVGAGAGAASTPFAGLANGTQYTFQVRAINEQGPSGWSAASNPVIPAGPPFQTAITSAVAGVGLVDLTWNPANGNGVAIAGYEVLINGISPVGAGGGTTYRVGGLNEGTDYTFQVRGVNEIGPGPWSAPVTVRTPGRPAQVGGLDIGTSGNDVVATWNEPANNGSPITHYTVDASPGGQSTTSSRSHRWNNAGYGAYSIQVAACNAVGCGPFSGGATLILEPPAPTVSWSKGARGNIPGQCDSVYCHWANMSASGLRPNTTYTVTCHGSGQGSFSASSISSNGNGDLTDGNTCMFGYPDEYFWVTVGPHESAHRLWGR